MYSAQQWFDDASGLYDDDKTRLEKVLDARLLNSIKNSEHYEYAILDVACGTGSYLSLIEKNLVGRDSKKIQVVGIDISLGMLLRAKEKLSTAINLTQGNVTNLPFASNRFNHISIQSAMHLIDKNNTLAFFKEVYRVLKKEGMFSILTYDVFKMDKHWVYQVFPTTRDFDKIRFIPILELIEALITTGFSPQVHIQENEILFPMTIESAIKFCSNRRSTSQFMALSDEDLSKGVNILKQSRDLNNSRFWWNEIEIGLVVMKT